MTSVRSVGVEEELFLVDPVSAEPVPLSAGAVVGGGGHDEDVEAEMFAAQVETSTEPASSLAELTARLATARRAAARSAEATGSAPMASSTTVVGSSRTLSGGSRYAEMMGRFGRVAQDAAVCGMHVHVGVEDEREGVRVVDALAPWLPVVAALSAASPFADGQDTGFASWRAHRWDQWPSAGPVDPFGDVATYRDVVDRMVRSGTALDEGMVYLDARLGRGVPTVEVRVCDVQPELGDAVALAALVRGLVTTAAEAGPGEPWRVETLRWARWAARRDGVARRLLDPRTGDAVEAGQAVQALLEHCSEALDAAGDRGVVERFAQDVVEAGGSAARQREVAGDDALRLARHLVHRTAASIDDVDA